MIMTGPAARSKPPWPRAPRQCGSRRPGRRTNKRGRRRGTACTRSTASDGRARTSGPAGRGRRGRCRFATMRCRQEYALANQVPHPRNVYLREDALTDPLDTWLASAFAPHRIEHTITAMADAQPLSHPPTTGTANPSDHQRVRRQTGALPRRPRRRRRPSGGHRLDRADPSRTRPRRSRSKHHREHHPTPDEPRRDQGPRDRARRHHHRAPRRRPSRQSRGLPTTRPPTELPAGNANGAR